mgnify:CR=1 FL=1
MHRVVQRLFALASGEHFRPLPHKQKSHRFCISASTMASYWSGRRGSNSLPPPWQGGALPDELRPHIRCIYPCTLPLLFQAGSPQKFAKQSFCGEKEKIWYSSQKSCLQDFPMNDRIFQRGASDRNRTNDTGIFSPLLYRLSYRGKYDPDRARTDDPQRDRLVL